MKRLSCSLLASAGLLLLGGCPSPTGGSAGSSGGTGGGETVAQVDSLFEQQAEGSYEFSTNDSEYWGSNGYTLWALTSSQAAFSKRDVKLTKTSGNAYAGYGFVFCEYDSGDAYGDESMLVVMINEELQYSVGVATGSTYTAYTSSTWVTSDYLHAGQGMTNEVQVTGDGAGHFVLSLNGNEVLDFQDGRTPLATGGGDGYLVVISPQDSFPQTPVTVEFMEN